MGGDLIAVGVALGLGAFVVAVGLGRDLSETTRDWLPRFDRASAPPAAPPAPPTGSWGGSELSQRQWRWLTRFYLALGIGYAAMAVLSADGRWKNAVMAALWAIAATVALLRRRRFSRDESTP